MSVILVVEQDPGYANRIVAALQAVGHEVVMASTRDEAEGSATSSTFDLVLANGMMPGAGDLLGRFSAAAGGPGSVVLLPVTLASHTDAAAYSADDVLSKPFSDEDLERVVSSRLAAPVAPAAPAQQPAAPLAPAPRPLQPPRPEPVQPTPRPARPKTIGEDVDDLLNRTLSGLDISMLARKRPKPVSAAPTAPAPQPIAPKPPTALTSIDIFGDVLAEVEAESAKTRSRQQAPAAPRPAAPRPATPPAAEKTAEMPSPERSRYDDDLDRKLEETLSGVLPSRLRRPKPEEKPPARAVHQPVTPPPAAPPPAAPPPRAFAPPHAAPTPPETALATEEPELPVDFSEDETISMVRPANLPRDPSPEPAAAEPAKDDHDFFATTLLPTRSAAQLPSPVQPPTSPPASRRAEPLEAAAPEPAAPESSFSPFDFGGVSGDDFEISFGEEEPAPADDDGGNIWSAYGSEETGGWGTTSFELPVIAAPELDAPQTDAPDAGMLTVEPDSAEPVSADDDFDSDSMWEVPSFTEESSSAQVELPTDPLPPSEAPSPEPASPSFDPAAFDVGPSLLEDPEFEIESDFAPVAAEAPGPAAPPTAAAPPPVAPAPAPAGGALDELSHELGADDTGSFHTALKGVLQIRGEDGQGTSADDQGVPFGDYRLLDRVAVGGMAEVWRARRRGVEGFQKTVAIKRILSHLTGSTDFISMFIDEAKLAAQLNHANIAQIYDLGKVDDDFYIAMEFVEGRDLRTLLREAKLRNRPLPLGHVLFIIAAVARGLDYAHRKRDFEDRDLGLVHRDVSPQNVLVSTEGEIKLCDFGIAKAVAKASTTQMGALKGKLQYMSPEQAWGKEVDGRSDIFSLGTVLFEALTSEKLFTGDSELGVLDAVRDCRLKSARAIDPTLPESVERILEKTLRQSPEDRYQTAGEMEQDIRSVLETLKPSPGQSDLAKYMHRLLEAPVADAEQGAGGPAADGSAGAWTGTSWGTSSFYAAEDSDDASSEPVSAKVSVSSTAEPPSSKPPAAKPPAAKPPAAKPPAAKPPAAKPPSAKPPSSKLPSSKPPFPKASVPVSSAVRTSGLRARAKLTKKRGGKLIWILLILTMLAIVAAVVWTRRGSGDQAVAPVAAPTTEASPEDAAAGDAAADGEGDEAVDQKALMEQIVQEEMLRKKQEMEEQFEAQKLELERRLREVAGEDGGGG